MLSRVKKVLLASIPALAMVFAMGTTASAAPCPVFFHQPKLPDALRK